MTSHPNDIIPEPDLGKDTGGTSQRRGVHGDPWRTVGPLEVGRPSSGTVHRWDPDLIPGSPAPIVVGYTTPIFVGYPLDDDEVSVPMAFGFWGLSWLVGWIYGFVFFG